MQWKPIVNKYRKGTMKSTLQARSLRYFPFWNLIILASSKGSEKESPETRTERAACRTNGPPNGRLAVGRAKTWTCGSPQSQGTERKGNRPNGPGQKEGKPTGKVDWKPKGNRKRKVTRCQRETGGIGRSKDRAGILRDRRADLRPANLRVCHRLS
jgi:hypothetical protein